MVSITLLFCIVPTAHQIPITLQPEDINWQPQMWNINPTRPSNTINQETKQHCKEKQHIHMKCELICSGTTPATVQTLTMMYVSACYYIRGDCSKPAKVLANKRVTWKVPLTHRRSVLSDSEIALRLVAQIKRNRIMSTNGSISKSRSDRLGKVITRGRLGRHSRSSDTVPRQ